MVRVPLPLTQGREVRHFVVMFALVTSPRSARKIGLRFQRLGLLVVLVSAVWVARGADAVKGLESMPFAARSRPTGATMFTPMASEQTGIVTENTYADPEMWGQLNQEFALGAIGTISLALSLRALWNLRGSAR